jgi:hypothetical protein
MRIATSHLSYMMVKNQQMLELQVPQCVQVHYVNRFVHAHFYELCLDN